MWRHNVFPGRHYKYDGFRPDNPYIPLEVFEVRRGGKYYFRMICSSQELTFSVSIDNHPLHVVATDGADIVTKTVDVIIISPGERYDFWIDATDPEGLGLYWIRAVTMELFEGGWKVRSINTLRPRQLAAIFQTTFSNAFSWMKMYLFRLRFHWSLFLVVQLVIFQHWFR